VRAWRSLQGDETKRRLLTHAREPSIAEVAEADAQGNITATFDYRPYGSIALGTAPKGPGYTGHVNDPDTGLVYMQARYYDPVVGRFLSTDPVRPIPGRIDYTNRFSYVGNNPVSRIDPTGSYICNGSKAECDAIRKALRTAGRAADDLIDGSTGRSTLNKIISFYGDEGSDNGVAVGFGNAGGNNGQTVTTVSKDKATKTDITFNLASIKSTGSHEGTTPMGELAATVIHEGQHGVDGRYFGPPANKAELLITEFNAYMSQSYVNQGLRSTSPYGVWQHVWVEGEDANSLRMDQAAGLAWDAVYGKKN
jgi:RHS repeat-associated protein